METKNPKPLGGKNYGNIAHLPSSRMGPGSPQVRAKTGQLQSPWTPGRGLPGHHADPGAGG